MTLDLAVTLTALAACAGLFVFASRRADRAPDPLRPRLVPWRAVVVTAGAAGLLAVVHLLNLMGLRTGQGIF